MIEFLSLWRLQMRKLNLMDEIQELREELHEYINKKGINNEPEFYELNTRLDELIVKWIKQK